MRLRVPGNVLLAGEYAVLEPGGLGLCLAVEDYVIAEAAAARETRITGVQGRSTVVWTASSGQEGSPLFAEIVRECERALGGSAAPLEVRLDSSSHLYPDGRKKGIGSSAAVSVALAALLLGADAPKETVFRAALAAHRRAQGGRGSGYDVAASTFGGPGLFTGGTEPGYRIAPRLELPFLGLVKGPNAVATASAVTAYANWKGAAGEAAARFLADSNDAVRALAESASAEAFASALDRAAALGKAIGEAIGVSAAMGAPGRGERRARYAVKALGAGNELGLAYSTETARGEPLRAAGGGLEWLEA